MFKMRSEFLRVIAMIVVIIALTIVLFGAVPDTVDATTRVSVLGSFRQLLAVIAVIICVLAILAFYIGGAGKLGRFLIFMAIFAALVAAIMITLIIPFQG
jgi:hypothetical protein